ncbi:hypothetical protein JVT61DRAFT_9496 [Boletus reticuloceps]|uniref:Uncharacterized protein n=1 Tax=Boletus reticuloceps TaxID=495285 RepID=A0A8I3A5Q9_9AGAM|nr:hypothetical protein JVT61DRAFT_9496 [Boletus reticuloceps]
MRMLDPLADVTKKAGEPHLSPIIRYLIPAISQKQRRGRKYRGHALQSPLEEFFGGRYPQFEYNATESASHEFYRLCDEFGWDRDDPERQDAHREFKNALVKQFNEIYGTDEEDLAEWKNLCHIVDIDPVPDDLDALICGTHVNLVDLVDRDFTGQDVQVFESERELSQYTRMTRMHTQEDSYDTFCDTFSILHRLYPPQDQPMLLNGDLIPARVFF